MSKKLNLETYNEILFGALKEKAKKSEIIEKELNMAYSAKIQLMEELVGALNNNMPYHEILTQVNIVDANCDHLLKELEKYREEEKAVQDGKID